MLEMVAVPEWRNSQRVTWGQNHLGGNGHVRMHMHLHTHGQANHHKVQGPAVSFLALPPSGLNLCSLYYLKLLNHIKEGLLVQSG